MLSMGAQSAPHRIQVGTASGLPHHKGYNKVLGRRATARGAVNMPPLMSEITIIITMPPAHPLSTTLVPLE